MTFSSTLCDPWQCNSDPVKPLANGEPEEMIDRDAPQVTPTTAVEILFMNNIFLRFGEPNFVPLTSLGLKRKRRMLYFSSEIGELDALRARHYQEQTQQLIYSRSVY